MPNIDACQAALDDLHRRVDEVQFRESDHPRAPDGKFGSKGGGKKSPGEGKLPGAPQVMKETALKQAFKKTAGIAHNFTKEDYHLIVSKGVSAAGSEERSTIAGHVAAVAKALPSMLKSHLWEEKHKFVGAAGALKSMATGKRPTPEQNKALRAAGVTIVLSAAGAALHGDPTGVTAHAAVGMITALAHEIVNHTIVEHAAKLGAGVGRYVHGALRGRHDNVDFSAEDIELLQEFAEELGRQVKSMKLDDEKIRQLLERRKENED